MSSPVAQPAVGSPWVIGCALGFVAASGIAWWGSAFVGHTPRSFTFIVVGLACAGAAYTLLSVIEGVPAIVRRGALVLGFALAIPLALFKEPIPAAVAVFLAILLSEFGALQIGSFRKALQHPRIMAVARHGWAYYFAGISIMLALIVSLSPIGATVVDPIPESVLRWFVGALDPVLRPTLGFSLQGDVDQLIAQNTGSTDPEIVALIRDRYSKSIGIPLTGKEDLAAVVSLIVRKQIAHIQETQGLAYRFSFFASVFLFARFLMAPLTWLVSPLTLGVVWVLRNTGAIVEIQEPVVRTGLRWQ